MPRFNRRNFLVTAGATGAAQGQTAKPGLLITSSSSPIGSSLANYLADRYNVRRTERRSNLPPSNVIPGQRLFPAVACALADDTTTRMIVAGVDGIVHVSEPLPGDSQVQQMDAATHGTYNLIRAAIEHKVRRVVYLSTLDLMTAYDPSFTVSESWSPRPPAGGRALAKHLGEFTCREFAREGKISIVVLRVGTVVRSEEVAGKPFDPLWVDERDVAQAVAAALVLKMEDTIYSSANWAVFHIGSDSPRARFSVEKAKSGLGYKPRFNG